MHHVSFFGKLQVSIQIEYKYRVVPEFTSMTFTMIVSYITMIGTTVSFSIYAALSVNLNEKKRRKMNMRDNRSFALHFEEIILSPLF